MFTSNDTAHGMVTVTPDDENEEDEPRREEVEKAIKELKKGKSPGCDNITAEEIQASGEAGINIYHILVKNIWRTGIWPLDWKRAIFIILPKKGDLKLCSTHSTISLISHASKILLKIIMRRMKLKLEEVVSNRQAGFRTGIGTRDHILNIRILIQKCQEMNKNLHICFIDYSKAIDCVKLGHLWTSTLELGFSKKLTSLIQSLYIGQQSAVRTEHGITDWFPNLKGVRQGCVLSPYLFSIYTRNIMRKVDEDPRSQHFDGVNIGPEEVVDLRYADDTALLSNSTSGLDNLIATVKEKSEEGGLHLNVKKTKIMDVKGCDVTSNIFVDGERVETSHRLNILVR